MKALIMTLGLLLSVAGMQAHAAFNTYEFADPIKKERFDKLINELRCTVCQNQTIADSNADLAKDLREKTYEMVKAGNSEEEIVEYMVARYGAHHVVWILGGDGRYVGELEDRWIASGFSLGRDELLKR